MDQNRPRWDELQEEVQEIAEVLARRSGVSIFELWSEALTLYRVRYETEVLLPNGRRYPLSPDT